MKNYSKLSDEEIVDIIKSELKKSKSRDPILDANEKVNALFEIIYQRYHGPLLGYLSKMIFDQETAADIFHEVIIKIYTNIHRFTLKTSFKAWVYKIATNLGINYIHKNKRSAKLLLNSTIRNKSGEESSEIIELLPGKERAIDDAIAGEEIMKILMGVIDNLPRDLKEVFMLKNTEKLTYTEIGEILGYSSRYVKSKMAKALNIITQELKKNKITPNILNE